MSSFLKFTISRYTTKTWAQHNSHGFDYVYSLTANKTKIGKSTIALMLLSDAFIGFIEFADSFKENNSSTSSPYTEEEARYNAFRAPVLRHHMFSAPKPVGEVMRVCGMTSKVGNGCTHPQQSYSELYYTGENCEQMVARFEALATQWVAEASVTSKPAKGLAMIAEAYGDAAPATPASVPVVAKAPKNLQKASVKKDIRNYLRDGEIVYNMVRTKEGERDMWTATYVALCDTLMMDDARCFQSINEFYSTHRKEKGNTSSVTSAWNACYVERDGKRVNLRDVVPRVPAAGLKALEAAYLAETGDAKYVGFREYVEKRLPTA